MSKGQFPKLKGSICNTPVNTADIINVLPHGADSNGLVVAKLKRKLSYHGHLYFEAVRPESVRMALKYLKENNPLYRDIRIDVNNIPNELTEMTHTIQNNKQSSSLNNKDPCDGLEEENPLDSYRFNSQETMFVLTTSSEEISLAPGEGKQPTSMLSDDYCEELAFPYLFPGGKFGYKPTRELKLSPVKYFNQRLLNYTQMFASDSDYVFYALSVTQQLKLNSEIIIALRKVCTGTVTAGMLSQSFAETVLSFVGKDEAYRFMNTIKGTPVYWKKFLHEVLAMVKQLGLPTFFITLSCADLQWNELLLIIAELRGEVLSEDSINEVDFFERCRYLNLNPVVLARHFQYRVETFFKVIVLNGQFGKVKYHAIRVEFQVRGSPHVHSFVWIIGAPILTKHNLGEYVAFIDSVVKSYVPDLTKNPGLFKLVITYQVHSHSKSVVNIKMKSVAIILEIFLQIMQ